MFFYICRDLEVSINYRRIFEMIGRHLLRIKVFQTIYAYRKNDERDFKAVYSELQTSIHKSYQLYLSTLQFLLELKQFSEHRILQIQSRVIKDEKEWKRLVPFAENKILNQLEKNKSLQTIIRNEKISWHEHQDIVKELFTYIIESEQYKKFCAHEPSYYNTKKFIKYILYSVILQSESFFWFIEESSIFWNDDVDQIVAMVFKTLNKFTEKNPEGGEILGKFHDADAQVFVEQLFSHTLKNWDEYSVYITERLKNWDHDRMAEIDIILLQIAIAEAIHFHEIPVRVTLNEYIELSKLYSTDKSNIFINGILHSIFDDLQEQKIIVKKGRGLLQ